jgi:hypothetical protein
MWSCGYLDLADEFFLDEPGALALLGREIALVEAVRKLEESLLGLSRTRAFIGETVINIP